MSNFALSFNSENASAKLASDSTGAHSGFVGAFQIITNLGDPDVFAVKLQ